MNSNASPDAPLFVYSDDLPAAGPAKGFNGDPAADWILFLTRPFSLFECSLWNAIYTSDLMRATTGFSFAKARFEQVGDVARCYRSKGDLKQFEQAIARMLVDDLAHCVELLKQGVELNEKTRAMLADTGSIGLLEMSVTDLIDHYINLTLHASVLPYFFIKVSEDASGETSGSSSISGLDSEVERLCIELRGQSFYPDFQNKILKPFFMKAYGLSDEELSLCTVRDLRGGSVARTAQAGKLFRYEVIDGIESVTFVDDDLNREATDERAGRTFRGTCVYKGKVRGKARVVLSHADIAKTKFDEGDILVTINSNPAYMPLILKAGALVSEEGGSSCHTAVIARQSGVLKKPTVMGIENITQHIKDGDLVEVDASSSKVSLLPVLTIFATFFVSFLTDNFYVC